ncbi:PP2C family protein-serine/threonine phosphatase [Cellulomonas carbonis]|uniref:Histidine kinase n=1 Tax=Cellulomonas carbonis T26 TaxID=947969 RepID=A0A0A0BW66_9CELL|nr:SpoIIE family protein phosphatase [Cellulomonas carbonis]KGM12633.1 histidine kinase [Cellulomonas carbonis T26]GGC06183.1 histidine kinase [Cellulomonas carbonis]
MATETRDDDGAAARPSASAPASTDALLEVLAQFDSLLEGAPLGIGIFDRDLRHVRVNAVLEEMNGRPADQLLGRTPSEVNGEVGAQAEVFYRQVMDRGVAMRDVRLTGEVTARPGQVRHWSTTFYPVRREDEVVGLCVIVDDVTAEQELSDALAKSRRDFQRLAEDLQRDLLPPAHPVVADADVAAIYRPANTASRVGGDFYDVVELDARRWLLVIGDVQGKGPLAASLSGALRYAVRTAAVVDPDPAHVMATVNAVLMGLEHEATCTAVCALLERDGAGWSVCVASAGHPAPLVVRGATNGSPPTVEGVGASNLLLGIVNGVRYDAARAGLAPGDSLVLYTDGITEARAPRPVLAGDDGRPLDAAITLFGEARLRAVLTEVTTSGSARSTADRGRADLLARGIDDAVQAFASGRLRDDVTLLVLHVPQSDPRPTGR